MQIKLTNIVNELQVNNPVVLRPFKNNKWERGKNIKETIVNFIRANQYQPANIIIDNVSSQYNHLVVTKAITSVLNMGVMRKKVTNPNTGRKVFVYYVPQGSLFELQVTNPNPTAEEVYKFWNEKINKTTEGLDILWTEYIKMRTPYVEKYIPNNLNPKVESSGRLISLLSQQDLNKFYNQMKQLVQKYA